MNKDRRWFYIAVLTLILAMTWAGMTAWSKNKQSTIPLDVEKIMLPLNPKLDSVILNKLQQKTP